MQIVTLTTDWGYKDHYIGVVKGRLYSTISDVNVVDITHDIRKFDLVAAAFIAKNTCFEFPEGTIHIIDVNSYESKDNAFIAVKHNGQYYICTDNGLPSVLFEGESVEIVELNSFNESNYYTFAVLDLFAKVAKNIAEAGTIAPFGIAKEDFAVKKTGKSLPIVGEKQIITEVIYVDDYGNVFLNITAEELDRILMGRNFSISIGKHKKITKFSQSYADDIKTDDVLLTISSTNLLQIAIKEGNMSRLRSVGIGSRIIIDII